MADGCLQVNGQGGMIFQLPAVLPMSTADYMSPSRMASPMSSSSEAFVGFLVESMRAQTPISDVALGRKKS